MNFLESWKLTFPQITSNRLLEYFFGIFYFVSLLGKVLDYEIWYNFHFGILEHWIGYVNASLVLLVEFYFCLRFLLGRVDVAFVDLNLIFMIFLTGIVAIFPNYFEESCLCFGKLFEFGPGFGFFAKNTALISLLFLQRKLVAKRGEINHFK